jgi:hypothetical protein
MSFVAEESRGLEGVADPLAVEPLSAKPNSARLGLLELDPDRPAGLTLAGVGSLAASLASPAKTTAPATVAPVLAVGSVAALGVDQEQGRAPLAANPPAELNLDRGAGACELLKSPRAPDDHAAIGAVEVVLGPAIDASLDRLFWTEAAVAVGAALLLPGSDRELHAAG